MSYRSLCKHCCLTLFNGGFVFSLSLSLCFDFCYTFLIFYLALECRKYCFCLQWEFIVTLNRNWIWVEIFHLYVKSDCRASNSSLDIYRFERKQFRSSSWICCLQAISLFPSRHCFDSLHVYLTIFYILGLNGQSRLLDLAFAYILYAKRREFKILVCTDRHIVSILGCLWLCVERTLNHVQCLVR